MKRYKKEDNLDDVAGKKTGNTQPLPLFFFPSILQSSFGRCQ